MALVALLTILLILAGGAGFLAAIFPLVAARADATALSAIAGSWHLIRGHVLPIFLALPVLSLATIALSLALELWPEGLAAILSLALFALMTVFQATMQATIFTLLGGHAADLGKTFRGPRHPKSAASTHTPLLVAALPPSRLSRQNYTLLRVVNHLLFAARFVHVYTVSVTGTGDNTGKNPAGRTSCQGGAAQGVGTAGNVVPFHGTPAPQSNCGLILSLANYPHIAKAFGQATAQRLQHRLGAMLRQHFASSFITSVGPDGYFELQATDLAAASLHPEDIGSRDFLAALHSTIAGSSIEVDGHKLRAVLAGTWSDFDDPAQVTSGNRPAPPSLRFSGEDVRNDAEWQARYRQDLALADELFAGLHEDGIGQHDRWGCLVWQPVNLASLSSSVLFCDLAIAMCTAQGELGSARDHLDALGRLGLLDAAIRQLFLRAFQELANYPDVVLCLSVPARAARPDGDVLAALTAGLAAKPQLACRLVVEVGGDSNGKAAELAGFCDRVRRLGCPISLGGFAGQGASARDLVALAPDYVRPAHDGASCQSCRSDGQHGHCY